MEEIRINGTDFMVASDWIRVGDRLYNAAHLACLDKWDRDQHPRFAIGVRFRDVALNGKGSTWVAFGSKEERDGAFEAVAEALGVPPARKKSEAAERETPSDVTDPSKASLDDIALIPVANVVEAGIFYGPGASILPHGTMVRMEDGDGATVSVHHFRHQASGEYLIGRWRKFEREKEEHGKGFPLLLPVALPARRGVYPFKRVGEPLPYRAEVWTTREDGKRESIFSYHGFAKESHRDAFVDSVIEK